MFHVIIATSHKTKKSSSKLAPLRSKSSTLVLHRESTSNSFCSEPTVTMPSTVKVRITGARNLPAMDGRPLAASSQAAGVTGLLTPSAFASGTPSTDAYVLVTLGGHAGLINDQENSTSVENSSEKSYTARTKVCRRTLNPVWDEEFRFEVADDTLLQDEPLIFKVYSDSIGADESIGLVYIDLNPLLMQTTREDYDGGEIRGGGEFGRGGDFTRESRSMNSARISSAPTGVIDGWFPLYDTLGGVRGELGLSVKLTFIGDVNPFRDSSAGVELFPFSTLDPAAGYKISHVFGFVEELLVADDPEYQWNENFRQARTSHETRQTLLYLLDASVRRRMCKKVLEVSYNFYSFVSYLPFTLTNETFTTLKDGRECGAWLPPEL
jgi:C2 domain